MVGGPGSGRRSGRERSVRGWRGLRPGAGRAGPDLTAAGQERGVLLVGIDYLSIASYRDPAPTHEALLPAGVTILESLDLRAVDPGWWTLTCLPLRIPGADGAPARALLSRPPPPDRDR